MVAVDKRLRDNMTMINRSATATERALEIVAAEDDSWVREFVDALDREVRRRPLERFAQLWDLSNSGAARCFGVSRQAYSKWLAAGPPPDRADDLSQVDSITDLLDRYVKRERIPAVVRRPAAVFGGVSLIEALEAGRYRQAASAVAAMFDIRRVQP